jgi:hypothetical protein
LLATAESIEKLEKPAIARTQTTAGTLATGGTPATDGTQATAGTKATGGSLGVLTAARTSATQKGRH